MSGLQPPFSDLASLEAFVLWPPDTSDVLSPKDLTTKLYDPWTPLHRCVTVQPKVEGL